jgi:hypothetical protein
VTASALTEGASGRVVRGEIVEVPGVICSTCPCVVPTTISPVGEPVIALIFDGLRGTGKRAEVFVASS